MLSFKLFPKAFQSSWPYQVQGKAILSEGGRAPLCSTVDHLGGPPLHLDTTTDRPRTSPFPAEDPRSAYVDSVLRWPDGVVPIDYEEGIRTSARKTVEKVQINTRPILSQFYSL